MCVYVCDGRHHLVCCARMYSDYEKNTARLLDTLRNLGCIRGISVYRFCCPSRLSLSFDARSARSAFASASFMY